jgi:hypothetical protein
VLGVKEHGMKERKIVQIASIQDGLAVLCNDGSLWKVEYVVRTKKWEWTLISESGPKSFE